MTIEQYINQLEQEGSLDPNCRMCKEIFYPALKNGKDFWEIFAPRHKAMDHCKSGKYAHCTCDSCF